MHFLWLMTTVVLFISFFDNGNVKGNNLEIQVTRRLQEITDLKERMDSLQNNIEWYISTFLNNKFITKINSIVEGFAQENVIRINLENKIISMEKENGQRLEKLWTTIGDINRDIEDRLLAKANATELSFGSKLEETVRNIEQKCKGSISNLNQTLENLYEQITQWRVPKQVNGGWTAWGSWTNCSSTCGKGINNRVRTCTNPAPADGGNNFDGDGEEYNECQIISCKVNGGWAAWGSWTRCSSTCGKGIKNRVRTCTNPAPANGGNYCVGVGFEYNECQIISCKVNGGWTAWGSWTYCSSTCGKGMNNRVRTCINPAPANGGNYCDGVAMEYNLCEISSCKVNGGWTAWGSWTNCSSTCGKGMNNRVRTCTNPAPANGGNYCDGVAMEYNLCEISSCKVNGGWTAWGSWTSCSSTCGKGMKKRDRKCSNPAQADGGNYCDGVGMEYDECQINSCEVNGGWTSWTNWGQCLSANCRAGIQTATRACTHPMPAHGGQYCDGEAIRYRECFASSNCTTVKARLVSGRLEVLNNGIWGTVCDDNVGANEANVACRMMGIDRTGSVIEAGSVPDGEDPIWLDDLSCVGTETSLFHCGYNGDTIGKNDCKHSEDVGVRCS